MSAAFWTTSCKLLFLSTLAAGQTKVWDIHLGNVVHSTPGVSPDGNTVYVGTGGYGNNCCKLIAVDSQTGAKKWSFSADPSGSGSHQIGFKPAVSPDGTTVYTQTNGGKVIAVSASGGTQHWSIAFSGGAVYSNPHISQDGSTLYVGRTNGMLTALSTANGSEKWTYSSCCGSNGILGEPLLSADDKTVFAASGTLSSNIGAVFAVNAADGSEKWSVTTNEIDRGIAISPDGKSIYSIMKAAKMVKVDIETGALSWTYSGMGNEGFTPSVSPDSNLVYVASWDTKLHAVSAATGAQAWTYKTGGMIDSTALVSPDGNTLFVASEDEKLHAVNAKTGEGLWTFTAAYIFHRSSPVFSKDCTKVFIGSEDNRLYAIKSGLSSCAAAPTTPAPAPLVSSTPSLAPPSPAPPVSPSTTSESVPPNTFLKSYMVAGVERAFLEYAPSSPQGMVVLLHGKGETMEQICTYAQVQTLVEERNVAVVCPQALGFESNGLQLGTYWRSFPGASYAEFPGSDGDEDMVFLKTLVKDLQQVHQVTPEKTLLAGCSNGGSMAYRFACEAPELIQGVAGICQQWFDPWLGYQKSGQLTCSISTSKPTLWQAIGTQDSVYSKEAESMMSFSEYSSSVLGCAADIEVSFGSGDVTCFDMNCPSVKGPGRTRFCRYSGVMHQCHVMATHTDLKALHAAVDFAIGEPPSTSDSDGSAVDSGKPQPPTPGSDGYPNSSFAFTNQPAAVGFLIALALAFAVI